MSAVLNPQKEPHISVALVNNRQSPVVSSKLVTWRELVPHLSEHKPGDKDGPGWMPARIEPGPRRAERVQHISALVLDVEAKAEKVSGSETKRLTGPVPPTVAELAALLEVMGWQALIVTSHSHMEPAETGTLGPRYRLTMPVSRPIQPDELKPLQRHVASLLGLADCVDTSAMDVARLFYLPRCPAERQHLAESREVDGEALDVDALIAQAETQKQPKQLPLPRHPTTQPGTHDGQSVIAAFNEQADVGHILEQHGYEPAGHNRWKWPGSTTGLAGVIRMDTGRIYSHHQADPLFSQDRHAHDAFSVWAILQHGGDMRQAVREAARTMGMEHKTQPVQGAADWPELDPLPDIETLVKPPEAFPFDALGPIAGPAAAAIAAKVQAPGAIAAGSVLSAIALAAQPLADVVLPHGATAPLSLFLITAATSGDRKSATDAVACEPIEEFKREQFRRYNREVQAAKEFGGPKNERPDPPKAISLTVSKGTVEGLTKQLLQQSHIGLFSPDGADVLGGHSMQAERRAAGIAWFLRAWSGETLDNLTAGNGLMMVSGRRLTVHLLVQPVVLQSLMADPLAQGQGLVARALIACPDTLAGTRKFRLPSQDDERLIAALHQRITELLAQPAITHPDGDGLELKPRRLQLDAKATALWIAFHDEVEARQASGADLAGVRPWASKAAEQAARVAGNLAVLEGYSEVQAQHMVCGMKVTSFYLTEHVRLMGVSADLEHARRLHALLDFLRKRGPFVTREEALQYIPRSIRNLKAEGITPLWDELTQRGYIRKVGSTWEVRR